MGTRDPRAPKPDALVATPPDLRVSEFVVEDERFLVLSHALVEAPALPVEVLTSAESEVVQLVMRGASNDEIAEARGTSSRTVANQLASIYRKLGVSSRVELAAKLALRA